MVIEDNRKTKQKTPLFGNLEVGETFFFETDFSEEADEQYGVCMKIDDWNYYNFKTKSYGDTDLQNKVYPVNSKLVLY